MRRPHPCHLCNGRHGTGERRRLPNVSDPAAKLRVAGKTLPRHPCPLAHPAPARGGGVRIACRDLWLRRSGARERCEATDALAGRAARLSPPASLAYDDLAVRRRAWDGCLSFFHFAGWGERNLSLEMWTRAVIDEGSGPGAGNWPSDLNWRNDLVISVPGILCLKYCRRSYLLEHRAPSLSMKDIKS